MTQEAKNPFNCFNLSPNEYAGLVLVCCQNRRNELTNKFNSLFPESLGLKDKLAIIMVGSDGKEERHPQSKTELVILFQNGEDNLTKIISILNGLNDPSLLIEEFRNLDNPDEILSFHINNPQSIYPDRILNSVLVWGNNKIHQEARKKVVSEMIEDSSRGKKIREAIKGQLYTHKKTIITGKYRGQIVFDSENQCYFESNDPKELRYGFKMGPLRAVQRKLDLLTIEAFKRGLVTIDNIENLPTDTVSRIEFFANIGLIDKDFAQSLIEAYLWFLREYHRIQEEFKQSDRTQVITLPYNQEEFNQYIKIIKDFVGLN